MNRKASDSAIRNCSNDYIQVKQFPASRNPGIHAGVDEPYRNGL
jgi:hypothetical protein